MKQEAAIGVVFAMGGSALYAGTQNEGVLNVVLTLTGLTFFLLAFLALLPHLGLPRARLVYAKPTQQEDDQLEERSRTVELPKRGPEREAA